MFTLTHIHTHQMMEEAPSGSIVVENEMEEIQHYHNTIYKCIDYCVMHPEHQIILLSNTRLFTHQGESADTQILNGLKNIETKCLAEAAKLFIGVWCIRNTDISFICKDRAGEAVVLHILSVMLPLKLRSEC